MESEEDGTNGVNQYEEINKKQKADNDNNIIEETLQGEVHEDVEPNIDFDEIVDEKQ